MPNTLPAILVYLFSVTGGLLLGALVLQFATKWVAGFKPKYPTALLAVFAAYLASFAIGFLVGFCVGMVNKGQLTGASMVFILLAGFFASTGFYTLIIKDADRKSLPFSKACLVSLIQVIFAAVILAAIFGAMTINRNVKVNAVASDTNTRTVTQTAGNALPNPAATPQMPSQPAAQAPSEFDIVKKLAESGDVVAQFNLGVSYYKGQDVPQDYAEAVKWFRMAADQGYSKAQCLLGVCYANGNGVATNFIEAAQWYRKAADQGLVIAQWSLGDFYAEGNGVPQDYEEAVKWYRKAADQGDVTAQSQLGYFYLYVSKNCVEAVKWYRKAADQNDANAQDVLGCCYRDGNGVETNNVEAYKWFNLAAAQGYVNPGYTKLKEDTTRLETALGPGYPSFNLGDARIYPDATSEREALAALMTPDQIIEAQKLSREFQPHKESASGNSK